MNYHTRLVDLAGTRSYLNDLRNRVWQIGGGKMTEQRAGAGEKVRVIFHFSATKLTLISEVILLILRGRLRGAGQNQFGVRGRRRFPIACRE